jgi:hypothetical protein
MALACFGLANTAKAKGPITCRQCIENCMRFGNTHRFCRNICPSCP